MRGGAQGHPARLQSAAARAGAPCVSAARPRTHSPTRPPAADMSECRRIYAVHVGGGGVRGRLGG